MASDEYDLLLDSLSKPKPVGREKFVPAKSDWSLSRAPQVKDYFRQQFGRDLPVRNYGQGNIHNQQGWDHRDAMDVSLDPRTPEGQALTSYLRENNIPFNAFTGPARSKSGRVASTGPHIHVGYPSSATPRRYSVGETLDGAGDEYDELLDALSTPQEAPPATDALGMRSAITRAIDKPTIERKPVVTSTVREDVDFNAPVQPTPRIGFSALEPSDLSAPARVATGFSRIARGDANSLVSSALKPVQDLDPSLLGKPVTARVKTDGRMPTREELSDALLEALGAGEVGRRYRQETGRNIAVPNISEEDLRQGFDPKTGTYSFTASPNQGEVRILNAYAKGGIKEAEAEAQRLAEVPRLREGDDGPVAKGVADAGIGTARLMNNLAALVRDPESSARDAEIIETAAETIPEEKSTVGRIVRGITSAGASMPRYLNPAAPVVAYTENLHRGTEPAIKEGLKFAAAQGVASGVGGATSGMSPLARQAISRGAAGATNTALDLASGVTDPQRLAESAVIGAAMPVGRRRTQEPLSRSLLGLERQPRAESAEMQPTSEPAPEPVEDIRPVVERLRGEIRRRVNEKIPDAPRDEVIPGVQLGERREVVSPVEAVSPEVGPSNTPRAALGAEEAVSDNPPVVGHWSARQPRRKRGEGKGQFKKGKPSESESSPAVADVGDIVARPGVETGGDVVPAVRPIVDASPVRSEEAPDTLYVPDWAAEDAAKKSTTPPITEQGPQIKGREQQAQAVPAAQKEIAVAPETSRKVTPEPLSRVLPSEARQSVKTEKVDRTGMTPTQKEYAAGELKDYVRRNFIETEEYPRATPDTKPEEFLANINRLGGGRAVYRDKGEPTTLKIPGDGEFQVNNVAAANKLHQKLTGKPVEGMPKEEGAGVSTGSSRGRMPESKATFDDYVKSIGGEREAFRKFKDLKARMERDPAAAEELNLTPERVEADIEALRQKFDAKRDPAPLIKEFSKEIDGRIESAKAFPQLKEAVDKYVRKKYGRGKANQELAVKEIAALTPTQYLEYSSSRLQREKAMQREVSNAKWNVERESGVPTKMGGVDWFKVERQAKGDDAVDASYFPQKLTRLTATERADYDSAKQNIKRKLSASNLKSSDPFGLGVFADLAPDLIKVGKYHVKNGYREFKAWADKMAEDLGEGIRPHLERIWAQASPEEASGQKSTARAGLPEARQRENQAVSRVVSEEPRPSVRADTESPRVERSRSLPQSLERAGLAKGEDLTYETITNKETLAAAQKAIKEKGVDRSIADLYGKKELSAEDTATGVELIRSLQRSGDTERASDVASELSRKLTEAGQAVQAASIISRLSPEGVLMTAQKRLPAGKKLTKGQADELIGAAQKVKEAEGKISSLEKQLAELQLKNTRAPRTRFETLQERLQKAETEARARLEARKQAPVKGPQAGASTIPLDIADYAIIGASKLAQKGISFAKWSSDMVTEFGDEIKPRLRAIYKESYKQYDTTRRELLKEQRERSVRRETVGPLRPEDTQRLINQRLDAQTEARKARVALMKKFDELSATPAKQFSRRVVDILGVPRAVMTSFDLSWGLRHGKTAFARHPVIWGRGFVKQFKALKPEKFDRIVSEIEADPDFKYAQRYKLGFTSEGLRGEGLGGREEAYQTSLADKIPGVAASQRAFTAMADTVRLGWFKDYMRKAEKLGFDPENPEHKAVFEQGVGLINDATGRSKLPRQIEGAAPALNNLLFSPRFWTSRLKMLTVNPARMVLPESRGGFTRPARIEMFKTLRNFTGLVVAQLALAKASGADVTLDPEDKKFGKACWGDHCLDFSAGFQTHIRLAFRLGKNVWDAKQGREPKSAAGDILGTYLRGKESPNAAFVHDVFLSEQTPEGYGTDIIGRPVYLWGKPGSEGWERVRTSRLFNFSPMVLQDFEEAMKTGGVGAGVGMGAASFLGESGTTYEQRTNQRGTARPQSNRSLTRRPVERRMYQ